MRDATAEKTETALDAASLVTDMAKRARAAARVLASLNAEARTAALRAGAAAIRAAAPAILAANAIDMERGRSLGLTHALLDRLMLNEARIEGIAAGVEAVAGIADPVNTVAAEWERPNGLRIQQVRVPIGVIGIVYESRPNVTADAGALCVRSGNAVILRGGSEALNSSRAIHAAFVAGLASAGVPADAVQLVPVADRAAVGAMLTAQGLIDVIVPRGGKSLVARVQSDARVPVLAHLDGNNHVYVDGGADPEKALTIVRNAKLRRTGVCGAAETVLVDEAAKDQLAPLARMLLDAGCEVRGDAATQGVDPRVKPAAEADWDTEYLEPIVAMKLVHGVSDAIAHIERHGSHHTDAIVTEDAAAAEAFLSGVDSAIVALNASTQFADGGEFGFGAEIGIATGRLHARGPVGAEQLTTMKYLVRGTGQIRP
ncbi:glutamate-5-semialdehyde dehydrogenase [Zavarzinia aquatilis]|uniref:Gamma-glutamyl phosphate reductase n=1 Tax=Zavarzinia aquatilis TaxID=2211142 RepID=A0A317EBQ0_9PROT|nr:glutamate-5-semialdehyde dehydrogenase [Zavarzinia aquatilis]PWR24171.1 glutamate-5-semialdehyde dehydrogenase [Zavarzinia aquatilis]